MRYRVALADKMRKPTAAGLYRPRLETTLLSTHAPSLSLVCAPAGSGKTTLVARVAEASTDPVCWYRVTSDDIVPGRFAAQVAEALRLVGALPDDQLDTAEQVSEALPVILGATKAAVLVLDDLHVLCGTGVEALVDDLVLSRPPNLRMIISSRRVPNINLDRLRTDGAIQELDGNDLRFRFWEVAELFSTVYREPLAPQAAAALTQRTGGWAAGLQLFHLATTRKTPQARQDAVSALGPRTRLIRGYLARNVLGDLPPEQRQFLVDTSAFGVLIPSLCDALLDRNDSAQMLERLEHDQLFTTTADDGETYRYHEVLQRHLQLSLLTERGVTATRAWHARCAALLENAGVFADALRAHAMADDWPSAARLIRLICADGRLPIPVGIDDLLADGLACDDPWLALVDARRRLRRGSIEASVYGFERAADLLDDLNFRAYCNRERECARAWLDSSLSEATADSAWSVLRRFVGADPATTVVSGSGPDTSFANGVIALMNGNLFEASTRFAESVASTPDSAFVHSLALMGAVLADLADGRAEGHAERLEEIASVADAGGFVAVSRFVHGLLSAILAVVDCAPWRLDQFSDVVVDCDLDGDIWGAALLQLAGAVSGEFLAHASSPARLEDATARLRALGATRVAASVQALVTKAAGRPTRTAESAPKPRVRVRCFGGFGIDVEGEPIELTEMRPRTLALLRVLALRCGHRAHREQIIAVLWPDATVEVGVRRLQVAVSCIRHAFGAGAWSDADVVRRDGNSYRLVLPDAEYELEVFEYKTRAAARESDLRQRILLREQALDIYTDDVYPEEGPAEYVVAERERLRYVAAECACELARDLAKRGDHAGAARAARRSLDIDRHQDAAWTVLVDALRAAGDASAAARARSEHARAMQALNADLLAPMIVAQRDAKTALSAR